jgi:hypothetical protein
MADLPGEPGWYRLTDHGWEPVAAAQAQAEFAAMTPGYEDLVFFETTPPAMAEDPLF